MEMKFQSGIHIGDYGKTRKKIISRFQGLNPESSQIRVPYVITEQSRSVN